MIRYITAGESHGPGLTGIVEGVPAGLPIHENDIAIHLARRQKGYGRGGRMAWEKDRAIISSGVRFGKTMAGPIALYLENRAFEKDKANGMVPVNKQSHLRPLATINQVNKCISILKSKPKIKRSMWSRRAQEYEAKISSGKIYELAEVVRDLNKGDDLMVDQSYSERQLFEKAYERILSEFQIVLNVSLEDTQKKLDKALKRNLGGQTQPIASTPKSTTTELPVEEPIGDSDENLDE